MLFQQQVKVDFDFFFATEPSLIRGDIGLQREAFEEFALERQPPRWQGYF